MARVSSWALNGDNGKDNVGSNDLTEAGTVTTEADSPIPGQTNSAAFAGDGRMQVSGPTGITIADNISVGLWAKWGALDAGSPLTINDDDASNYVMFQLRSGKIAARAEVSGAQKSLNSTTTAVIDTWYWIVYSVSAAGTPSIYINGVKDTGATTGSATGGLDATPYVIIGAKTSTGVAYFTGNVCRVFFDNAALSDAAIAAEYASFFPSGEEPVYSGATDVVYPGAFTPMEYRP